MAFFKISPETFMTKRGLPPKFRFNSFNPSQEAMHQGLEDHRFWVHIAARRTGKSSAAAILAFLKMLEPGQQVMVIAPDYNLSTIIWDYMLDLVEYYQIETTKINAKDHLVKLINGSTFRLLSANNRVSLVGRAANLIIVDEAALIPDSEYFERDLRPAMSTFHDSRILFISTPRGKENYLHKFYNRGQDPDFDAWGSGIFPWHVNPALSEEDIMEAKKSLSNTIFRQEFYCDWAEYEGQIYKLIDSVHKLDLTSPEAKYRIEPNNEDFNFFAGLDMGYRDDTAFVVVGTKDDENFFIVDEYVANEGTTSTHAQEIGYLVDKWDIDEIYIDSANAQTKADLAYDYDIFCQNATKSVVDGISAVQVLIEQERLLFDEQDAQNCYQAMSGYRWNIRTEKSKPLHDKHSHFSDAVRYAIYTYVKSASISIFGLSR
jgi:hypothetical protein